MAVTPTNRAIQQGRTDATNDAGASMAVASTTRSIQARPSPQPLHAAAMIVLAWLPAIVVAASLPRFVPAFDRWPAHWELPALTRALMSLGRQGAGPIVLAGVGLVAVLAGGGAGWVPAWI